MRFHAVYWPAFLMSRRSSPLPKQVFGHGFLLNRGEKMSKSVGNVIDPIELAERFGVDPLRYFLLREVSFGQDGSYSDEAIVTRCNADLANSFGNLAQRCLSIIAKNCDGACPKPGRATAAEEALVESVRAAEAGMHARDGAISRSTTRSRRSGCAARDCNQYFADQAPWACARPIRRAPTRSCIVPPRRSGGSRSWRAGRSRRAPTSCSICSGRAADARDFDALDRPIAAGTVAAGAERRVPAARTATEPA